MTSGVARFRRRCGVRAVATAFVSGLVLSLAACQAPPPSAGSDEGFTWIEILDEDDADGRLAYYLVTDDSLAFAGGFAAMKKTPEVTQPLDAETIDEVVEAIQRAGWLASTPPDSTGDGPRTLSVDLRWRGGRRTFRIEADGRRLPPGTESVVVLLKEIADRRFQDVIDSLPRGR